MSTEKMQVKHIGTKSKEIWLEQGLKILEGKGPAALSIDNLAVRIKKTKGSFYHHFKNRSAYIKDLMAYYEQKTTAEIAREVAREEGQEKRIKKLTELVFRLSSRLELVIRAWALYEPVVREYQDRVDKMRLANIESLYRPSGMAPSKAKALAYKNYSIYIGIQHIRHLHEADNLKEILKEVF